MVVDEVKIVEGLVVRFTDGDGKRRPAIVLVALDVREAILALEGTTRRHWKDTGTPVLLEVPGRTRLQGRMGLSPDVTTYFYARERALHIIGLPRVLVNRSHIRSCPEDDLRRLQLWAFETLRCSTSRILVDVMKAVETRLSTFGALRLDSKP